MNALERIKKKKDEEAYYNPEISLQEKQKGNELFKKKQIPEAIQHYKEALKRNPKDHTILTNLAQAYMKMGEFSIAIRYCEQCLEKEPKFGNTFLINLIYSYS